MQKQPHNIIKKYLYHVKLDIHYVHYVVTYLLFSPARANATCVACRRARRSCAARVCGGFPAGTEPERSRVHDSVIRYAFCAYSLENNTFNLSDKNMRLSMGAMCRIIISVLFLYLRIATRMEKTCITFVFKNYY